MVTDYLSFKFLKENNPRYHNIRSSVTFPRQKIYHYFNDISLGNSPWVSTFEYDIPRKLRNNRRAWEVLMRDACIALIAMSENARNVQETLSSKAVGNDAKCIMDKVEILHPPQQTFVIEEKGSALPIVTFVGNAFYHKGGYEMLKGMDLVWQSGMKFKLNLVSNFSKTHWLDTHVNDSDEKEVVRILSKWSDNISVHKSIDNQSVINLFKRSNVAILPSLGETYGYAVIEAQACGCPVITTNSWAFPEINNNYIGWLLELPTVIENGGLKAKIRNTEEMKEYRKLLIEAIEVTTKEVLENLDLAMDKGLRARNKVKVMHDPAKHADRLKAIYNRVL